MGLQVLYGQRIKGSHFKKRHTLQYYMTVIYAIKLSDVFYLRYRLRSMVETPANEMLARVIPGCNRMPLYL